MQTKTASDFLITRISEWGLKRIYGYPGDGINGIIGAIDRANGAIEYVQVRHEEMAAFMACAHAKFTGEVVFVSPHPAQAPFICSTGYTTQRWIMPQSWRSWDNR